MGDIKGVIRTRKSKDRQFNGQKKRDKYYYPQKTKTPTPE